MSQKRRRVQCPHCFSHNVVVTPKGYLVPHDKPDGTHCQAPTDKYEGIPVLKEGEPLWMALLKNPVRKLK